jgi:hypothetical protein
MDQREERIVTLDDALRAVAGEDRGLRASARVDAALTAEVRHRARARRRKRGAALLALAAGLAAAVAVPQWMRTGNTANRAVATAAQTESQAIARQEVTTAFLPLAYSGVPTSNGQLVRLVVPRTALVSFGLAPIESPSSQSGTVLADVLVGEDGLARAIRFVAQGFSPASTQP